MEMTKLGLLASLMISSTTFAQDYIKCDLRISDNTVKCPIFRTCPEKELRVSTTTLHILLNEGVDEQGKIAMKRVILHPGSKKQDKNKIVLFKDDNRDKKVMSKEVVDMVVYDIESGINYTASKSGNLTRLNFKTPNYTFNMSLSGTNAELSTYLLFNENTVLLSCKKMNKEVFDDLQNEKEALDNFFKEKSNAKASKQ
jgi:hypothetical protein